MLVLFN